MSKNKKPGFTVKHGKAPTVPESGVNITDFYAYMPGHTYVFMPCRETWAAASINARLPLQVMLDANGQPVTKGGKVKMVKPSRWLDLNRPVEQMTWIPGMPAIIHDRLVVDGGWIDRPGVQCLNLYRPPRLKLGIAAEAKPWIEHVHKLYPQEAEHIITWLAQRVQSPEIKINHGLVFGGEEGIGKDTLLEPVKRAIGPWNFHEVSPTQMMGSFNGFVKSTILRINKARDLGETDRFKFYDHLKVYAAAPPDVLRINEKFLREYYMFNCLGIVISTNYRSDGIYLAEQDRRHFVAWSELTKADFTADYFNALWDWYDAGGAGHVGAYLTELDLSDFNPKRPPPRTDAWCTIVEDHRDPGEDELLDAIDKLGNPDALIVADLIEAAPGLDWLHSKPRLVRHQLERCNYNRVNNPDRKKAIWKIKDRRVAIYARRGLTATEQLRAARKLLQDRQ
jgi:Family of unknown function (DUF5906)